MLGFESYTPSKWLDGIFAITPVADAPLSRSTFRGGRWIAKTALITVLVAGASVAAPIAIAASSQTLSPVLKARAPVVRLVSDNAPSGYFESLHAAIALSPRLPEQSTESDPPFLF